MIQLNIQYPQQEKKSINHYGYIVQSDAFSNKIICLFTAIMNDSNEIKVD